VICHTKKPEHSDGSSKASSNVGTSRFFILKKDILEFKKALNAKENFSKIIKSDGIAQIEVYASG
jgi:hypothetical protein